jgi:hypothetical protein
MPFPLRSVVRRWRGLLAMMIGVGIALSIVMTLLAIGRASLELYVGDYRQSGADLYVHQEGGTLVPILPGDTPGTIRNARQVLSQIRSLPGVTAAVGVMNWSLERERPGRRQRDMPRELIATMGVDGDPADIPGMLVLNERRA